MPQQPGQPQGPNPYTMRLYTPLGSRNGSLLLDARLINGIAEKVEEPAKEGQEGVWVSRRPGLSPPRSTFGVGTGRGIFRWRDDTYSIFGPTLFKNGVSVGTVVDAEKYTFTACLGATPQLFLKNSTVAYVYDAGGGLVQVTDGDYPATTVPGCVYLDGTTYVYNSANNIYGSDFNDQLVWDPLNLIVAQIEPHIPRYLAKQLVYVVALKSASLEVFFDAGNATGSPLAPVQGSKSNLGCRHAGTVCDVGGDLVWVATASMGSVQVVLMSAVKVRPVSSPAVERVLSDRQYNAGCYSFSFMANGHSYYVLTLPTDNLTMVLDLESLAWYRWTDSDGNYLPIIAATHDNDGNALLQHAHNGTVHTIDIAYETDNGAFIPFDLYTANFDGGSRVNKTCGMFELVGEQCDATMGVSWSDDDYQTFTTEQMIGLSQERPMGQDGSTFRRRAYRVSCRTGGLFRLRALQLTLGPGAF